MDSVSLIVTLIFVGVIAIPIIYSIISKKKKIKKISADLSAFAETKGGKISEFDYWKNTSIGIDRDNHLLFFTRKKGAEEQKTAIDLKEIQSCRVINTSRSVPTPSGSEKVTDRLELVFKSFDQGVPERSLEFFNSANQDSLSLTGELQLIEKWLGIVNEELTKLARK